MIIYYFMLSYWVEEKIDCILKHDTKKLQSIVFFLQYFFKIYSGIFNLYHNHK